MKKYIYFNDKNFCWSPSYKVNKCFIEATINYLRDLIQHRGYLYLNDIYETFGATWDPQEDNPALIFGKNEPLITCTHLKGANLRINVEY